MYDTLDKLILHSTSFSFRKSMIDSSLPKTNTVDTFVIICGVITYFAKCFVLKISTNITTLNWNYLYGADYDTKSMIKFLLNNKSNEWSESPLQYFHDKYIIYLNRGQI